MAVMNGIKLNPLGIAVLIILSGAVVLYICGFDWFKSEEKVSMKELLSVSIELARRGGEQVKLIRSHHILHEKTKGKTAEGLKDVKTDGDMQSHRAIVYGFQKVYPGLTVISEEHENKALEPFNAKAIPAINLHLREVEQIIKADSTIPLKNIAVWIDPLDATYEYADTSEDLTRYVTTMVCVVLEGRPIIGVIYKPFSNETVWAWVDHGNSKSVKSFESKPHEGTNIIVSRSHSGGDLSVPIGLAFKDLKPKIVRAAGAGYKSLEVLRGNADAYVHVTAIKKWDVCAGNAILEANGGKMTDITGHKIDYSPNTSPVLSSGLVATINKEHNDYTTKMKDVYFSMFSKKPGS